MATTTRAFQPPNAPDLDVPAVPGVLEWLPQPARGSWWAVAGLLAGLIIGELGAYHALTAWGWNAPDVGAAALLLFALCSLGLYRQAVLLRDTRIQEQRALALDRARALAQRRAWDLQLTALHAAYAAQVHGARAWAAQWGKPPSEPKATVNRPTQAESLNAVWRAVEDLQRARAAPVEPERARVAVQVADDAEATTRNLAAARLLAAAYHNGPAARLVATALRGEAITARAMCAGPVRYMSDPQWKAATDLLARAGVLTHSGATAPWRLAPEIARLSEDAAHTRVIERLAAAGVQPGDLPGDLAA